VKRISIAVLSDMHFAGTDENKNATHSFVHETKPKNQNPIKDLFDLIERENLEANLVVSPGDLTVASCEIGLKSAWAELQKVATSLKAVQVIAATGNHDIRSREPEKSPEVWETLKKLDPTYPIPECSELQRLHYWAEHFTIFEYEWARMVVLNSCNCHGRGEKEFEKGRITEHTISRMRSQLDQLPPKILNILLCHHHPSALPELSDRDDDYSEMQHGAKLLHSLEDSGNNWVVIHGHKHYPTVTYAKGGSASPVIVSAGSFSAALDSHYLATATNQFYIFDFDEITIESNGSAGIIRAWDWTKGTGWNKADSFDSARPHRLIFGSGFGNRENPVVIAKKIHEVLGNFPSLGWEQLVISIPDISFMRIQDRITLIRHLKEKYGIDTTTSDPMKPIELVRRTR
jgi:predicted phosphodiesterase